MNQIQIRSSVKVTNPDHPRVNTAGLVWATYESDPTKVVIRFDIDEAEEVVNVADLQFL
jgi:hypothetical protein